MERGEIENRNRTEREQKVVINAPSFSVDIMNTNESRLTNVTNVRD